MPLRRITDWSGYYQPNPGRVPTGNSGNSARGPQRFGQQFGQPGGGPAYEDIFNAIGSGFSEAAQRGLLSEQALDPYFSALSGMRASDNNLQLGTLQSNNNLQLGTHQANQQLAGTQATAGATRDVGMANADAQRFAAEQAMRSAVQRAMIEGDTSRDVTGLQTGSAERINTSRLDAMQRALKDITGTIDGVFGGPFGQGLGSAFGAMAPGAVAAAQAGAPGFRPPYERYVQQIQQSGRDPIIDLLRGVV